MESLIKQTRAIFSAIGQEDGQDSGSRRVPPQKTQSLREKKRGQSWMKRQFSRQMSWDYDLSSVEYPTAVAAAAYAVHSLEESKAREQKETPYKRTRSINKTKSKAEDPGILHEPRKSSAKFTDELPNKSFKESDHIKVPISTSTSKNMAENELGASASSMVKKDSFTDMGKTTLKQNENEALDKAPERSVSLKKLPPVSDMNLNILADNKKPQTAVPKSDTRRHTASKPGGADSEADAWEKEEMMTIRKRYEKVRETIEKWEAEKNKRAKRKAERREAETEQRRAKAMQSYRYDIARIQEVAEGARLRAEKKRRKKEITVKKKADQIRLTGKIPATCLCF